MIVPIWFIDDSAPPGGDDRFTDIASGASMAFNNLAGNTVSGGANGDDIRVNQQAAAPVTIQGIAPDPATTALQVNTHLQGTNTLLRNQPSSVVTHPPGISAGPACNVP